MVARGFCGMLESDFREGLALFCKMALCHKDMNSLFLWFKPVQGHSVFAIFR